MRGKKLQALNCYTNYVCTLRELHSQSSGGGRLKVKVWQEKRKKIKHIKLAETQGRKRIKYIK